jgi:hypothetical protein
VHSLINAIVAPYGLGTSTFHCTTFDSNLASVAGDEADTSNFGWDVACPRPTTIAWQVDNFKSMACGVTGIYNQNPGYIGISTINLDGSPISGAADCPSLCAYYGNCLTYGFYVDLEYTPTCVIFSVHLDYVVYPIEGASITFWEATCPPPS